LATKTRSHEILWFGERYAEAGEHLPFSGGYRFPALPLGVIYSANPPGRG